MDMSKRALTSKPNSLAIKEYVEFNPDGTGVELRFVESDEGIDLGYQDVVAMYDFVADDLLPAFQGFFV